MRRGQISLEFIMTYGWVLFIIFAGLAVIYATGVFSFSTFLPESCTFYGQIQCVETQFNSSGVGAGSFKVKVSNGFGVDLVVYNATLQDSSGISCTGLSSQAIQWPANSVAELNLTSCSGTSINKGQRYSGNIIITFYRNNSWCGSPPTSCLYTSIGNALVTIS